MSWRRAPASRPHAELITFVADRPGHDFRYAIDPGKICERTGLAATRDRSKAGCARPSSGISPIVRGGSAFVQGLSRRAARSRRVIVLFGGQASSAKSLPAAAANRRAPLIALAPRASRHNRSRQRSRRRLPNIGRHSPSMPPLTPTSTWPRPIRRRPPQPTGTAPRSWRKPARRRRSVAAYLD